MGYAEPESPRAATDFPRASFLSGRRLNPWIIIKYVARLMYLWCMHEL
jgi:hypothetical protein